MNVHRGPFSHAERFEPRPIPLEWFNNIKPCLDGQWLVKRLIPAGGLTMFYGFPGCGKSFLALDLAFAVGLGADWFGRRTKRAAVAYIAGEGQAGLRNRVEAYRRERLTQDDIPHFALIPTALDFRDPLADIPRLIALLKSEATLGGVEWGLIVVDTLGSTFGGGDENGEDMAAYVGNVAKLRAELSCAALVVHHRPKDSTNDKPRGHGSLWGDIDAMFLIEDSGYTLTVKNNKQKDGAAAEPLHFDLRSVELGPDEDGEPVTSCVVNPIELSFAPREKVKLTDRQIIARDALRYAVAASRRLLPNGAPENPGQSIYCASVDDWRAAFYSRQSGIDADTLKKQFQRDRDRLQSLKLVCVFADAAWEL